MAPSNGLAWLLRLVGMTGADDEHASAAAPGTPPHGRGYDGIARTSGTILSGLHDGRWPQDRVKSSRRVRKYRPRLRASLYFTRETGWSSEDLVEDVREFVRKGNIKPNAYWP